MSMSQGLPVLSQQCLSIVSLFEEALPEGTGAEAIATHLARVKEAHRAVLFQHLLHCQLQGRRKRGETPDAEEYRERFPQFIAQIDHVLLLVSTDTTIDFQTLAQKSGTDQKPFPKMPGYELLAELGKGGMGVVYHAMQVKLNRSVALKMVLRETQADSKELIRFLAEAEAVAAIDHPNVVRVYDYGESEGRPYLALEYLAGGSLADKLKSGRLKIAAAALVVEKIARGVAAAHELGIVHRDLKPGNVLLDAAGEPKVADFGLAKRGFGADLTQTQAVMGTPAYMSPEQAEGKTKFVGPPADVWALGVILYKCLTGQRPFRAKTTEELLAKLIHADPAPLRPRVPKLPRDLELICFKCLSKNPADRYATAGEVADDLRRFSAGEPVSVKPAGAIEIAVKWAKRKPTLAAALALGILAVLLGGLAIALVGSTVVAGWGWRTAETARGAEETQRLLAENAQQNEAAQRKIAEAAQSAAEKARGELAVAKEKIDVAEYGRAIQVTYASWRENNLGVTVALLEKTRPELRGWEWHFVHRLAHMDALTLKGTTSASFSPDGTQILTTSTDAAARILDARTGAERLRLDGHKDRVLSASFNRGGTKIVTASNDKTAKVWDAKTGAELLTLKGHINAVWSASFSDDGTRIVTAGYDQPAKVWNGETGADLFDLKGRGWTVHLAWFSADGTRITTVDSHRNQQLWDAKTGAEVTTQVGAAAPPWSFSPDGTRMVTRSGATARVCDAKTGTELLTLKGHTREVASASFSPDGTWVVRRTPCGASNSFIVVLANAMARDRLFTVSFC